MVKGSRDLSRAWDLDPLKRHTHAGSGFAICLMAGQPILQINHSLPNQAFLALFLSYHYFNNIDKRIICKQPNHYCLGALVMKNGSRAGELKYFSRTGQHGRVEQLVSPLFSGHWDDMIVNKDTKCSQVHPSFGGPHSSWTHPCLLNKEHENSAWARVGDLMSTLHH